MRALVLTALFASTALAVGGCSTDTSALKSASQLRSAAEDLSSPRSRERRIRESGDLCATIKRYEGALLAGALGPQVIRCEITGGEGRRVRVKLLLRPFFGAEPREIKGVLIQRPGGRLVCRC